MALFIKNYTKICNINGTVDANFINSKIKMNWLQRACEGSVVFNEMSVSEKVCLLNTSVIEVGDS